MLPRSGMRFNSLRAIRMKPIKRRIAMYLRQATQAFAQLFSGVRAGTKTGN